MNAFTLTARLLRSPAYRRCNVDLPSVCRMMERRTLARFPRDVAEQALRYARHAYDELGTFVEAKPGAQCYRPAAKGERLFAPCSCPVCTVQWSSAGWADENIVPPATPEVFPKVEKKPHVNTPSRFPWNNIILAPRPRVILDQREGSGRIEPPTPDDETPPYAELPVKHADTIANDIIVKTGRDGKKRKKSNGGRKAKPNLITCEALFCKGDKQEDGFSRTIALRYLSKRMVFAPRSASTGKEDAPKLLKARKTSSSRHQTAFYVASDVEDLIQDAFILYETELTQEGKSPYRTGNTLHDTCNACKRARNLFMRAKHKAATRLDILKLRMQAREDKERGYAARFDTWFDGVSELDTLCQAMREHGATNQKELALALGISAGELCKRLGRLRERTIRAER